MRFLGIDAVLHDPAAALVVDGEVYEEVTEHLGLMRSSDEDTVMARASHGTPRHLDATRELVTTKGDGGFTVERVDRSAPCRPVPATLATGRLNEVKGREQFHPTRRGTR